MPTLEALRFRLSWLLVAVRVQVVFVQSIDDLEVDTLTILLWMELLTPRTTLSALGFLEAFASFLVEEVLWVALLLSKWGPTLLV